MNTAILIIDVQTGMFQMDPPVSNGAKLLQNINKIISYARVHQIPLIYVQHNGPPSSPLEPNSVGWTIHEEITPDLHDIKISKATPDSFYNTGLMDYLRTLGVTNLIISGIQTELCVDTTCKRAFSLDYKVTLAKDAHSTFDSAALSAQQIIDHHNGLLRWFADIKTVEEIVTNQEKRS
ncbi:cysteine hydrolase family protein [Virgibacillus sp. DJP39]|uniref:cysteine hydrolase family protein n=1 Tax=Virgibacillus sp. DJP39 TaxID=3409790 RepID=UPI003BB629DE